MRFINDQLQNIAKNEKGSIISGPFGSNISSKFFVDKGIPVIRGNNLTLGEKKYIDDGYVYITREKADELNCWAYENDLIFTAAGTIGQVGVLSQPLNYNEYVISNKQIRVRLDNTKIDYLYAYYWFSSPWIIKRLQNNNKGSTVPLLTLSEIKELPIFYPKDLPTQKKIADVLSCIDDKIALNNKTNSELENMAKTVYDYWFTQFDFPDANGNPYKTSGGKMEYNQVLKREIPAGWEGLKLEKCLSRIATGLNPRDNFVLGNGKIKYLTVKNLNTDGTIDFSNCDLIDEEALKLVHARSDIKIGDILFASIAPLGRCYLIQGTPDGWDINESVFTIRPNTDLISSIYLYVFFMDESFVKLAQSNSTGSVFKGIRVNDLYSIPMLVPEKSIMNKFTETIKPIMNMKYRVEKENKELTELRDYLLPLLMNGQINVK